MEKFYRVTYTEVVTTSRLIRASTEEEAIDIVINREHNDGRSGNHITTDIGTKTVGDRELSLIEEIEDPRWLRSFA
jgi:hypothetical protein